MQQTAQAKTVMLTANRTRLITLDACISRGFSGIQLLGNLGETCREGRDRAKAALENLGIQLTQKKVLMNLSPADLKKDGNHFDLAIAVVLALLHQKASVQIRWDRWALIGELDLNGYLKPIQGSISMVLGVLDSGLDGIILPSANLQELATISPLLQRSKLQILGFSCLKDLLDWSNCETLPAPDPDSIGPPAHALSYYQHNFDDMLLSEELKLLIICVMTGRHHLLLSGSPGSGKSMLAERLPSLQSRLPLKKLMEVLKIYGHSREQPAKSLLAGWAPYRCPHHSLSLQALLGTPDRAGEVSLAHHGILFLDEFPEFRRDAVEALREPLEAGQIFVSRAKDKACWPAKPQLIAACNLCPCGWHGSRLEVCRCSTQQLLRYQSKLSGPIMDRIDIHFNMPEPRNLDWQQTAAKPGQTLELLQAIQASKEFSLARNQQFGIQWNSQLAFQHFPAASGHSQESFTKLLASSSLKTPSRRSLIKILRVARTLADIERSEIITVSQLKQAWLWHRPVRPLDEGV